MLINAKNNVSRRRKARMSEKSRNLHAWILWIVGIILVIGGIAVVTIHSHLRGSGLGTALLILGFIMVIIGVIRYMYKRPQ
jgi:uncharacterized membrane protein YecN with MAPEG domain